MSARWPAHEEDLIFLSRELGMEWWEISSRLPTGRSERNCRDYYQYWAENRSLEDAVILKLREKGLGWDDIAKQVPGRSSVSCFQYYEHHQHLQSVENFKNHLAEVYNRLKEDMWEHIGDALGVGWRAAEAMHWQLGKDEMAKRADLFATCLKKEQDEKEEEEDHESREDDIASPAREFFEWEVPPLTSGITIIDRQYVCIVPKCKGNTCEWDHCINDSCPAESCNRTFPTEGTSRKHLRVHFKPVQCPFCQRRASSQSEMKRHAITHNNQQNKESNFCLFCKKGFTRSDNLRRHVRMKHGFNPPV